MRLSLKSIPPPNFGKPQKIQQVTQKLMEKVLISDVPPKDRLLEAIRRFREWLYNNGEHLDQREIKRLSWALNLGEQKILVDTEEFKQALNFYQDGQINSGMLKGLINSFFYADDVPLANLKLLRDRIRLLLLRFKTRSIILQHWQDNASKIFVQDSELTVARLLLDNKPFLEELQKLQIPLDSAYAYRCIERLCQLLATSPLLMDRLPEILYVLRQVNNFTLFKRALDHIIQGLIKQDKVEVNPELCSYCLEHLGDPRLSKSIKWEGISKKSKDLIIRWLSTQDLTMFLM